MAGDFKAGEGRVEFTGDASGAKKAGKDAANSVEAFAAKAKGARKTIEDVGKVLRFFVLPLAIAKTIVGIIESFVALREEGERVKRGFKDIADSAVADLLRIRAHANRPLEEAFIESRASANAKIDAITKDAEAAIQNWNNRPTLLNAILGLKNPGQIERDAQAEIDRINRMVQRAAKPDRNQQRIDDIKKEAKAAAREMMTESERAEAERADQEERLNELRKQNLTDEQRAELEAAAKVFDKRRDFRKKEHSERVSLEDLAGKFDLSNVSRAAQSTTHAVNKQTEVMKRMGQGTVIKD